MKAERAKCVNCGRIVPPETASANNGLCMFCAMGHSVLSLKNMQQELENLKELALADPSVLGIEVPQMATYSEAELETDARPAVDFRGADFKGVYRGCLPAELFHPIGRRCADKSTVEIEYVAEPGSSIDYEWISNSPVGSPKMLVGVVREAFEQYMGDGWCGKDMKDEVIESLNDGLFYPEGEAKCFIDHGYFPYFEIVSIVFDRASDRIVIGGTADIDYNLDEHGVAILIESEKVTFGYSADHE